MKTWNELKTEQEVYIVKKIEYQDEENYQINETEPYQKAFIGCIDENSVCVVIEGGIADGYEFFFYFDESSPEEILTEEEYKKLNLTEEIIWQKLDNILSDANKLENISENLKCLIDILKQKRP